MKGILIPPADDDLLIRLHDYYFQACDVMLIGMQKIESELKRKGKISQNKKVELESYFQLWLGTLRVTVDGFRKAEVIEFFENFERVELKNQDSSDILLRNCWNTVQNKIKERENELRRYRNITFHFEKDMKALIKERKVFLDYNSSVNSVDWALDLHQEIRGFFRVYRPVASFVFMEKLEMEQ